MGFSGLRFPFPAATRRTYLYTQQSIVTTAPRGKGYDSGDLRWGWYARCLQQVPAVDQGSVRCQMRPLTYGSLPPYYYRDVSGPGGQESQVNKGARNVFASRKPERVCLTAH